MKKKNKAFTLIELLVVISILGIFAVIAYPNVIKWINDREVKAEAIKTCVCRVISHPLPSLLWGTTSR